MFIFRDANNDALELIENLAKVVENDEELKQKIFESNERILKLKKDYMILW